MLQLLWPNCPAPARPPHTQASCARAAALPTLPTRTGAMAVGLGLVHVWPAFGGFVRDALVSHAHEPAPVARGGLRGACLHCRRWDAGAACVGDHNRADLRGTVVPPPPRSCACDGTGSRGRRGRHGYQRVGRNAKHVRPAAEPRSSSLHSPCRRNVGDRWGGQGGQKNAAPATSSSNPAS